MQQKLGTFILHRKALLSELVDGSSILYYHGLADSLVHDESGDRTVGSTPTDFPQ